MGTTAEKLEYLAQTKADIKQAIIDKGTPVADTDTFRSYADKIAAITPETEEVTVTFADIGDEITPSADKYISKVEVNISKWTGDYTLDTTT